MPADLAPPLVRNRVSATRPYAVIDEREPDTAGRVATATTIFLTASECPIGCTMCDLWQNTLPNPTPTGAIARQIDVALENRVPGDWIKLYNSGNFFDAASIPVNDYQSIAKRCAPFSRVIVENHPRFGSRRLPAFRDLLSGQLEVAVGLETVQPRWLSRLNKQMTRDDFDRYAKWLLNEGVDLRVFLIVGVPEVSAREAVQWATLSARHACLQGARHISLIPARAGHGWNGKASTLPTLSMADLCALQSTAIADVDGRCNVTVDLWDLTKRVTTPEDNAIVQQISQTNVTQCPA
ncbi:MAG: hypothetical protein HKN47_21210 [Pirellulaceae bacterium]|nr:hypothetical protein [Pirellulaceae bacterium]